LPRHRGRGCTTPAASFLLLVARWAADPADPVALLSVLKHPRARVGLDPADLRQRVSDMEIRALSGPRLDADLASLAQRLSQGGAGQGAEALARELADLHHRLSPPLLQRRMTGPDGCEGLSRMAMALAAGPGDPEGANLYAGRSGDLAARFLEQLAGLIEAMGGLDSARFADLAEATAMGVQAPPDKPEHPRIAIWGPLEARLQRRDRMILASLNEGAWPRLPPAESFLNRRLRREAGLPDPDERVGLSAHDFAQLASAPDLILLRARRVDDKPAVASRWLWRLRTLAAGGLGDSAAAEAVLRPSPGQDPLAWADALRTPPRTEGLKPPAPKPPVHLRRLGKLSPSRVGRLIRDPYADFATVVLRLEPRLRPGAPFDAASRGRALHTALERFMAAPGATAEELDHLIRTGLIAAGGSPEAIELERPLWQAAARAYLNWTLGRQERVVRTVTEAKAAITLPVDGDPFVLEARADRIDLLVDGTLAIIDYKSGQPKRAPQVQSGLEPQLALEAAIAARAPFGAIGPAPASELIYYRIAASAALDEERNGQSLAFKDATTPEVAEAALDGLVRLVRGFRDPAHPYLSRPRVEFVWSASDYDRLARREEWAIEEGDGS
jgi:ATP-dependent helicase/nuclease subunit B